MAMAIAIQLLLVRSVSWMNQTNAYLYHICSNNEGKYKPKSTYEKNLNDVILDIHKAVDNSKKGSFSYYNGEKPYISYGLLQCRGDSFSSTKCTSCFISAVSELRKRCPMYKAGIVWFDRCFLKISMTDFYTKIDNKNKFSMCSKKEASDPASFNRRTESFLTKLASIATKKFDASDMYQSGELAVGKMKLYGMVQCVKDFSTTTCYKCLNEIIEELHEYCNGKEGGRILTGSCNFRFEIYPFPDVVPR